MSAPIGHISIRRRIWASCTITLEEPLHVGKGRETASPVDLPVVRDARGMPIIPGSTLKGFLRSTLSKLLESYKLSGHRYLDVKNVKINLDAPIDSLTELHKNSWKGDEVEEIKDLPLLDKIFGYAGRKFAFSSTIRITDARIKEEIAETMEDMTTTRTHVSIDRVRDAARKGMLVTVEAVKEAFVGRDREGKMTFEFTIVFDELADPNFKESNKVFYLILLDMLNRGLKAFLGGWKSRGYGFVEIKLRQLKVSTIDEILAGLEPKVVSYDKLVREVVREWQ